VETKVGMGPLLPYAKDCLKPPEAGRSMEQSLQKAQPGQHLDFGLKASRTVR
jgi:hypothetical protein